MKRLSVINYCTFLLRFLKLLVYKACLINSSKNWSLRLLLGHPPFPNTLKTWYSISLYSLYIVSSLRDSMAPLCEDIPFFHFICIDFTVKYCKSQKWSKDSHLECCL
jgi:hypothetical protein